MKKQTWRRLLADARKECGSQGVTLVITSEASYFIKTTRLVDILLEKGVFNESMAPLSAAVEEWSFPVVRWQADGLLVGTFHALPDSESPEKFPNVEMSH